VKIVIISEDPTAALEAAMDDYLDTRLGPAIAADAYRACPKRTNALADSIEHHVTDHTLIVSATGSDERDTLRTSSSGTASRMGPA
jgi:hypothetical protein